MTAAAATTTAAGSGAADPQSLASDFVQECLGFHTTTQQQSQKLDALAKIRTSLQSCSNTIAGENNGAAGADPGANGSNAARESRWRMFLEGTPSAEEEDEDDGFNDSHNDGNSNFMLRDSLIQCLVESCSFNNVGEREDDLKVVESSLVCLADLISLRCSVDKKSSKSSLAPIFGHDFVTSIAGHVVAALELDGSGSGGVRHAASQLVIALLRGDRPRNENCAPTIRDSILLPACSGATETNDSESNLGAPMMSSMVYIAQILSTSIICSVELSVPSSSNTASSKMDEEELSMRRETAALNKLQDMRDVIMALGVACHKGLLSQESGQVENFDQSTKQILGALQEIYDIAAFAIESQLETLLGDEKAMPILTRLRSKGSKQSAKTADGDGAGAAGGNSASGKAGTVGGNALSQTFDESLDDTTEDGKESELLQELNTTTLGPLYANLSKPPIFFSTTKHLESLLENISAKLNRTEASLWDERLDALVDLECILAGGVVSVSDEARCFFIEKLRKMPLPDQFKDLRSQITQQACRVIVATSYEYRSHISNDAQLNQAVVHFMECCIFPSILHLCKSGTRLMATQGMQCLQSLCAVCGNLGQPRTVPRYCEEILGDAKVHKNRKRGSVMALTSALRVWDSPASKDNFVKHLDLLVKATKEAATNRDPGVREEGRKMYWAMHACCDETHQGVEGMFNERSREMKNLQKERESTDAEWEAGGMMCYLAETGVLDEKKKALPKKTSASSRVPPPKSRSSFKRPNSASARLRAEHGTPFKTQKVGTPMKLAENDDVGSVTSTSVGTSTSNNSRPLSNAAAGSGNGSTRRSQLSAPSPVRRNTSSGNLSVGSASKNSRAGGQPSSITTATSTASASAKSEVIASNPRSALKGGSTSSSLRLPRVDGKENSSLTAAAAFMMTTPVKKSVVGFHTTPIRGTPVVNLLARASPLSVEKVRNTGDILGTILSMLSDTHSPHEQSLGIKALALFAKDEPSHGSWKGQFSLVLDCLLDQIRNMPSAVFKEPVEFIRSPSKKNLSSCHQMQHLFLQGVRSLLQFVPEYVESKHVEEITCCMLECTNDAPFEIVHTAERVLQNLVTSTDPDTCFEHLLPFTSVEIDLDDRTNPPALLSSLRTMRHLIERVSIDSLRTALPSLLPVFHNAVCHKSVDMRKATIFVLVEMHFVFGQENGLQLLDEFTDCQRRLVNVYIDRHPKNNKGNAKVVASQRIT